MSQFIESKRQTDAYRLAVRALGELEPSMRLAAYAEVESHDQEVSLAASGLKDTKGSVCLARLLGKQCTASHYADPGDDFSVRPHTIPRGDHDRLFVRAGKPVLFLSQPYGIALQELRKLVQLCDRCSLNLQIDTWPAPHFPGRVLSVQVWDGPDSWQKKAPADAAGAGTKAQ
jgi:hypothetical protein